jgi:hypothetical protein
VGVRKLAHWLQQPIAPFAIDVIDQHALGAQPADDCHHAFARLRPGQPFSFAHLADDRGVLEDAFGQFGLAQAVLAMQVLAQEIAEWVAYDRLRVENRYLVNATLRNGCGFADLFGHELHEF